MCEDGQEYLERFERYFGASFEFVACPDFVGLRAQLEATEVVCGILLDLDFRRADPTALVDELGQPIDTSNRERVTGYAGNQGLCIASALRNCGYGTTILLFADIDAAQQREFVAREFTPLELVPSCVGLSELKRRFDELAALSQASADSSLNNTEKS